MGTDGDTEVAIHWRHGARTDVGLQCTGDNTPMSDNIEEVVPMERLVSDGEDGSMFTVALKLKEGLYRMRFLVDGEWSTDSDKPCIFEQGIEMNVLEVGGPNTKGPDDARGPESSDGAGKTSSKYKKKRRNRKKTTSELRSQLSSLELKSQQREAEAIRWEAETTQREAVSVATFSRQPFI
jgi:hypothetical protein